MMRFSSSPSRPNPLALLLGLVLLAVACSARAKEYALGPTRALKTLSAVLPLLQPGDIVNIDAATYHETAHIAINGTREAPITLRGVGATHPVFDAQGLDTSGQGPIPRGVWQIEGAYLRVEHLEFKNARNGNNAAGVRLLDSTNAVIRDCKITQCDMGIFGGDRKTALIEGCEVAFNGTADFNGYSHNFYMAGNRVIVRNCSIHDALYGQNYKSRAHYNELWFNWIANSNEGEIGCVDEKGATDRPHSNTLLVGNVVMSRADRSGNTSKFVLCGSESGATHEGTLFLFRNTFVAGDGRIQFVTLSDSHLRAVLCDNVFVGSTHLLNMAAPPLSLVAQRNVLPPEVPLPEGWTQDPASNLQYTDGDGATHRLVLPATAQETQ